MDAHSLLSPVVADREALLEFVDALSDHAANVERCIALIRNAPEDRHRIAELFRAVHNIKGDATLCKVAVAIAIAHPIETVLSRFREGEIGFSDVLAEAILLAIDRLELAAEALAGGRTLDGLHLPPLVEGLERLALALPAQIDARAGDLIESVTGFRPAAALSAHLRGRAATAPADAATQAGEDLRFFRSLAAQFEARSPLFRGRTTRILRLAQETNLAAGKRIDPLQLEAAVYMHDVGMMLLPESIWLKVERMSDDDKQALRTHPGFAAGLLARMDGWSAAAEMVAQHHEMPDGAGYPLGLKNPQICDGARVLAIVDAFEAVMLKHIHRGKNRSVLRAIAEINACDRQFAPEWIEPFNRVIRRTVEAG